MPYGAALVGGRGGGSSGQPSGGVIYDPVGGRTGGRRGTGGGTSSAGVDSAVAKKNADAFASMLDVGQKAGSQVKALSPYKSATAVDPRLQEAYAGTKGYAESLADRSNESITNALQRGRDTIAQQLSDVRTGAGARGAAPGSGLSGVLQTRAALSGQRELQGLQTKLTDVALEREGQARRDVVGAAETTAADQRARDAAAAGMYQFSSNIELEKAKTQQDQSNRIMELALRYANPYTGFE